MRGSDPDAAVYYLAAMLEGGEDPRFIARRMVILASEDIGNADPQALVVAVAAAQAVEHVGPARRRSSTSPRRRSTSRSRRSRTPATSRIGEATQDVREHGNVRPPKELRDAHYPGAKKLGHGAGLRLPARRPGRLRGRLPARRAEGTNVLPAVTLSE